MNFLESEFILSAAVIIYPSSQTEISFVKRGLDEKKKHDRLDFGDHLHIPSGKILVRRRDIRHGVSDFYY